MEKKLTIITKTYTNITKTLQKHKKNITKFMHNTEHLFQKSNLNHRGQLHCLMHSKEVLTYITKHYQTLTHITKYYQKNITKHKKTYTKLM